jgi:aspartate/methionine/tyrosine aminotransferase
MREGLDWAATILGRPALPATAWDLAVAQNHLGWELLAPKLKALPALAPADVHYQAAAGELGCRMAIARLFNNFADASLTAEHLVLASGAAAVIEMLGFALGDEHSAWLCPTPWYPSFAPILKLRANVALVPIVTEAQSDFKITSEAIAHAHTQARAAGKTPRAILLSSPHNPLGRHVRADEWAAIQAFCLTHDLDCVLDALYWHSGYGRGVAISGVNEPAFDAGRLHVIYGFGKDWGLSGMKLGVLITRNQQVRSRCQAMAHISAPSSLAQHVARHLLDDDQWVTDFIDRNQQQLASASEAFAGVLRSYGVPLVEADAGLFLWVNLSRLLSEATFEAEAELAETLKTRWHVALAAGQRFASDRPGWFRLCFALPQSSRPAAINALQAFFNDAGLVAAS